jgi:hypothetical protein
VALLELTNAAQVRALTRAEAENEVSVRVQAGEGVWIRDAGHALRVACEAKEAVPVGAEVEVFGFVKREEYGLVMEDALFRQTGKNQPVAPTHLTKASEAFGHDADLVEIT